MNPEPPPGAEVIPFTIGRTWIDENNFCRISFHKGASHQMGIGEVKEMAEAAHNVCKGNQYVHLIDCRGVYGPVLPGAREEVRHNPKLNACRKAAAIIVNNMANKLIMTFFIQFNKPPYPYRVYEDADEAVKWLKSL